MRGDLDSQHPHLRILEFHLPVVGVYLYRVLSLGGGDRKAHQRGYEQYSTHASLLQLSKRDRALQQLDATYSGAGMMSSRKAFIRKSQTKVRLRLCRSADCQKGVRNSARKSLVSRVRRVDYEACQNHNVWARRSIY